MDISALLIQITGVIFFGYTAYSIYKLYKNYEKHKQETAKESKGEKILNSTLLYLWLTFSIMFSLGMIFNNPWYP